MIINEYIGTTGCNDDYIGIYYRGIWEWHGFIQ